MAIARADDSVNVPPWYWGVNSLAVVNQPFLPGKQTVYDWVVAQTGATPDFWGRYIGPSNPKYPLLAPLTKDEAQFIFDKSKQGGPTFRDRTQSRVFPIYNGLTNSLASVQGGSTQGKTDALTALDAAIAAEVPKINEGGNVLIYGDLEDPWTPTAKWFQGWIQGMHDSTEYWGEGGLYANLNLVYNFATPYQNALNALGPGGDRFLWSTQPWKGRKKPGEIDFDFQPAGLVKFGAPSVVMWQYARGCLKHPQLDPNVFQGVDFNMCKDSAYTKMWSAS
jgi:hypothetical protein